MKLIFSRKGFDSSTGKVPSPILPTGELWSLPIPEPNPGLQTITYGDIRRYDRALAPLIADLTQGNITAQDPAHLDPDLDSQNLPRQPGWRPVFGQSGAAERHLQNQGITTGDLFLFFGWFRQVKDAHSQTHQPNKTQDKKYSGRYRYDPTSPHLHVLFGWLQVEHRIPLADRSAIPTWALCHPHCQRYCQRYCQRSATPPKNTHHSLANADSLYIATPWLTLTCLSPKSLPGAGLFPYFHSHLCLTAPGHSRRIWQLPSWFYPTSPRRPLTYHGNPDRWTQDDDRVLLNTVGRGQEFVLDCADYPEVFPWLNQLFLTAGYGYTTLT